MSKIVFVYGADAPLAAQCAQDFAADGYTVYASAPEGANAPAESANLTVLRVDPLSDDSVAKAAAVVAEKHGKIDILVMETEKHLAGDGALGNHDYKAMLDVMDYNVNGPIRVYNAFVPLLEKGEGKRIAVLTAETASTNLEDGMDDYAYLMSQSALQMAQRIKFNLLRPAGFTFRNFTAEGADKVSGLSAKQYIEQDFSYDVNEPAIHNEEDRLIMRDCLFREIPW